MIDPAEAKVLRAKYLDWCSAKVADHFLGLTPDEIYELAHEAPPAAVTDAGGGPGGVLSVSEEAAERPSTSAASSSTPAGGAPAAVPGEPYRRLVERVTEVLAARLRLPAYEEWAAAYRASPERYDEELLGFWRGGL